MGAAKNRKAEIAQLKTQPKQTVMVHASSKSVLDVAMKLVEAAGWKNGYSGPDDATIAFKMLKVKLAKDVKDGGGTDKDIKDIINGVLVIRDGIENVLYKKYPTINKFKFKSTDADNEIKKITDPQDLRMLGILDLLCGILMTTFITI